jgi:hypothetical protein
LLAHYNYKAVVMFFRIEDLFKKEEQQLVTEETDTAKKDKAEDVEIKDTVPSQTE